MLAKTAGEPAVRIGPYELLKLLGEGGMGAVYKARHRQSGQLVALKVVRAEWAADPILRQRFEREFRVASSLKHPNFVQGLDFGLNDDVPFFVMELVEGETLGDYIRRKGLLPEGEAIRIITQVAEALQFAHQQNYIHRDLKPDNVLLTATGTVKVADLGLVKCMDTNVDLTQGGNILGTPYYIAPEQFDDARKVDASADIYSLGATLYAAVTGQIPFCGRGKPNYLKVLKKKMLDELVPPRHYVPNLSEAVDFAIRRAMRAQKAQRFSSCEEFILVLNGQTPPPQPSQCNSQKNSQPAGKERRGAKRYQAAIHSQCQPVAILKEKRWCGQTKDISASGIRLVLPRRFEPGTLLIVELKDKNNKSKSSHVARVVRVQKNDSENWSLGCAFLTPLSSFELEALV